MQTNERYQFTKNMETLFQNQLSGMGSFLAREDYQVALSAWKKAPKDAKKFRNDELVAMCEARGLDPAKVKKNPSLLDTIPTREELKEKLLESFYEMYQNAPSTGNYMERMVRRLVPEYSEDTVRTAILKKFVMGSDSKQGVGKMKTGSVLSWAEEKLTTAEKASLKQLSEEERKKLLLSKVDDTIFPTESIELTPAEILSLIAEVSVQFSEDKRRLFDDLIISEDTILLLDDVLVKAGAIEEGMPASNKVRAIGALLKDGKITEADITITLSDALEKDIRAQISAIKKKIKKENIADKKEPDYKQKKKDRRKSKKKAVAKNAVDINLLAMCSDLASGYFRPNGKTKIYLYYFAFMFGMKLPLKGVGIDEERDIIKNLFFDFYSDNVLRCLSGDYIDPDKKTALEKEPTGEGINFKNFAEVIYLYYLSHTELAALPGQRINAAEAMIKACVTDRSTAKHARKVEREYNPTRVFRDEHFEILMNKDEDDIKEYIIKNYQIISASNTTAPDITIASEENTAAEMIGEMLEEMDEEIDDYMFWDETDNTKEFVDINAKIKEDTAYLESHEVIWNDIRAAFTEKYSGDEKFMNLLAELNKRLSVKGVHAENAHITRNGMIALHMSKYLASEDYEGLYSLQEIFEDYERNLGGYLEEARFQPLNSKNIFDMYVVTAFYFYLVKHYSIC